MQQAPTRRRPAQPDRPPAVARTPAFPDRSPAFAVPKPPPAARRRRRRDPLWARLTVVLGALLMMASGAAIVGSKLLINRYEGSVTQANLLGAAAAPGGKALDGAINILLLGVDERLRNPGEMRSDTIIILHVPPNHGEAYLMSVPRDTWVDAPAFEKSGYGGGRAKITDVFYFGSRNNQGRAGGAELVALTLKQLTGITFNAAAIIDFYGFKGVIDQLGGVNMCVDHRVKSQHMRMVDGKPTWLADARKVGGGEEIWHEKGCRRMEGWAALDYARQRYGLPNTDYDRQRHQQQLLKAMAKEATSKGVVTNPIKLDGLVKAAGRAFVLDTGGVPLADFVFTLKGIGTNDLVMLRTNAGTFNSARIPGTSAEALSEDSMEMFAAARDGTLAEFVVNHPEFIAKEK